MSQDNLIHAVNQKHKQVSQRYKNLDKRTKPRVPHKLKWIINENDATTSFVGIGEMKYVSRSFPLDKLARTFCALEEFENWLEKVENGIKKHQEEMERQASTKICRLKTFAALSCNFEKGKKDEDEKDIPF